MGNAQPVIATIDDSFRALAPPTDDCLLHPQCCDDGDIAEFYGAPDWRHLADEMVVNNYAALSFFSAEAFRYYLPAFMVFAVTHPQASEYVVESTVRALDPMSESPELRDFQLSKYALFNGAQCAAIVQFLAFMSLDPDLGDIAKHALASYWQAGEVT